MSWWDDLTGSGQDGWLTNLVGQSPAGGGFENWLRPPDPGIALPDFSLLQQGGEKLSHLITPYQYENNLPNNPLGQLQPGNIDLTNRPQVQNPDGSVSTVRSIGVNIDGREVLIPTVSEDGRIMSEDEAIKQYKDTGRQLGVFDNVQNSNRFAQQLHEQQANPSPFANLSGAMDIYHGLMNPFGAGKHLTDTLAGSLMDRAPAQFEATKPGNESGQLIWDALKNADPNTIGLRAGADALGFQPFVDTLGRGAAGMAADPTTYALPQAPGALFAPGMAEQAFEGLKKGGQEGWAEALLGLGGLAAVGSHYIPEHGSTTVSSELVRPKAFTPEIVKPEPEYIRAGGRQEVRNLTLPQILETIGDANAMPGENGAGEKFIFSQGVHYIIPDTLEVSPDKSLVQSLGSKIDTPIDPVGDEKLLNAITARESGKPFDYTNAEGPKDKVDLPYLSLPKVDPNIVYHGTPHDFENFDLSKIGTGEGSQAFGHGFYFAENPEVAHSYANQIAGTKDNTIAQLTANDYMKIFKGDKENAIKSLQNEITDLKKNDSTKGFYNENIHNFELAIDHIKNDTYKSTPNLLASEIPPKDQFIDYDKPIGQQDPNIEAKVPGIQKARRFEDNLTKSVHDIEGSLPGINKLGIDIRELQDGIRDYNSGNKDALAEVVDEMGNIARKVSTGRYPMDIATQVRNLHEGITQAWTAVRPEGSVRSIIEDRNFDTQEMAKEGVKGVKYLDRSSRGKGEGTRNYVVFDPNDINVIGKKTNVPKEELANFVKEMKDKYGEKNWRKGMDGGEKKSFEEAQLKAIEAPAAPVENVLPFETKDTREFKTELNKLGEQIDKSPQASLFSGDKLIADVHNPEGWKKASEINTEWTGEGLSRVGISIQEIPAMKDAGIITRTPEGNWRINKPFDNVTIPKRTAESLLQLTPEKKAQLKADLETKLAAAKAENARLKEATSTGGEPPNTGELATNKETPKEPPVPPKELASLSKTERALYSTERNVAKANPEIGAAEKAYRLEHETKASEAIGKITEATQGIDKASEQRIIRYMDGESIVLKPKEITAANKLRKVLDEIATEASDQGVLTGYRKNYFTHINENLGERKVETYFGKDKMGDKPYGSLEKSRKGPDSNIIRSFDVLKQYADKATRRVAEAKYLGKDLSNVRAIGDPETVKYVNNYIKQITNRAERAGPVSKALGTLRHVAALGDLTLTSVLQVGQGVHTAAYTGLRRATSAAFETLKNYKKADLEALKGGALYPSISHEVGIAVGNKGYMHGVPTVDRAMRVHAFIAGRMLLEDAKKGNGYAKRMMTELGIKDLNAPESVALAGKLVADKTQLRSDISHLPAWFKTDAGKMATQYLNFAYANTKFMADMFKHPVKNMGQISRFAVLGAIAGEGISDFKEAVKSLVPGKSEDDDAFRRMLDAMKGADDFDEKSFSEKLLAATRNKKIPLDSPGWRMLQNLAGIGAGTIFQTLVEKVSRGDYKSIPLGPAGGLAADAAGSIYKDVNKTVEIGEFSGRNTAKTVLQNLPIPFVSGYKVSDYLLPKEGSKRFKIGPPKLHLPKVKFGN
jgi:hypothetical protein